MVGVWLLVWGGVEVAAVAADCGRAGLAGELLVFGYGTAGHEVLALGTVDPRSWGYPVLDNFPGPARQKRWREQMRREVCHRVQLLLGPKYWPIGLIFNRRFELRENLFVETFETEIVVIDLEAIGVLFVVVANAAGVFLHRRSKGHDHGVLH